MNTNYDWKVFVPDKKYTHPEIERRICVVNISSKENQNPNLFFAEFYDGRFKTLSGEILSVETPIFWRYLERLPSGFKTISTKKCTKPNRNCEYEDDGYCLCRKKQMKCKYLKQIEEYYSVNS